MFYWRPSAAHVGNKWLNYCGFSLALAILNDLAPIVE